MVEKITLRYFRSYKDTAFSFSPKTNIIIGKNGSGKTNILESILVLCVGKSYRANDNYLIHKEYEKALVEGVFDGKKRSIKLQKEQSKKITIQNKTISRITFNQTIPTVLFEPDFMQILSRGPEHRRDYFDTILSKTLLTYQTNLNKYKRTLTQRNNLLKRRNFSKEEMFVWNIKLSELGGYIANERNKLLDTINEKISETYSELADTEHTIDIRYTTKVNTKDYTNNFLKKLEENEYIDIENGFTSIGPHRDDFVFTIDHKDVSISASRGENRTILLALKIIETKLIEDARQQKPILLLDDVFSELDETRQGKLVDFFYDNQVIITTTNITPLMHGVSGNIIEL